MATWLRRVRGAVLTGVTWALVWAPVALLIGLLVDPDESMDEMWPMVGAIPGFLGGVAFAIVLGVAARHRRLDDLSLRRVGAWGALAGLAVGVLPFLLGEPTTVLPLWLLATIVIGPVTLLSAASAAASLALARRGETAAPLGDGPAYGDLTGDLALAAGRTLALPERLSARVATARPAHAVVGRSHLMEGDA